MPVVVAGAVVGMLKVEIFGESKQCGGHTICLTKGLDNIQGTNGNDTIIGSIDTGDAELNTLSSLDIINGGAGTDTLKIQAATALATANLPNLSSVEVIEVTANAGVTLDTSAVAGVTNLNLIKSVGAATLTGAATTDIKVDMKAPAAATIVQGGKDVNVKLTDVAANTNTIAVGSTTAAKGDVVVEASGKAAVNSTNYTMGTIGVTGGKTISITQKAGDASGLVAGDATATHTQGAVTATANAETTSVTIKQDAAATAASTKAVAKVDEVATVTFTKLDNGESVTVSGLTFTASKDLTAEQVAAAFANLSSTAPTPTELGGPTTATGDTNGGSVLANGVFTGALLAKWSSAAASGNTVTFTASGAMATNLAVSGTGATVVTTTEGKDAVTGANTLGVVAGTVTIGGGAALKTVTVDGYAASTGLAGVTGVTNTALDTISLSNGAGFEIDSAAATLALTLNKVNGTVDVQAGTKTLNATVTSGSSDTATLTSASAEAVNVSGTGTVAGITAAGGLTAATAINTTGMTGGKATFTIANGTATTYTGGAGVDSVTVSNANTAITKAIDLGAGDDTLTLDGAAIAPTATLKGGEGTDTIAMNAESAATLSANGSFADKIEGFEKLAITDNPTVARTVNMANMDGIKYVVSNNSTNVGGAAVKEVFTVDFATSGTIAGADTIVFDGLTVTLAGGETPAQIAAKFITQSSTSWDVTGVNGSAVTFTAKAAGVKTDVVAGDFTITDTDATTAAGVVTKIADGNGSGTKESFSIDFTSSGTIEDADTIAFDGTTITLATGDNANAIAGKVGAGVYTNWDIASVAGAVVTFTYKTDVNQTDPVIGDFTITNVEDSATGPVMGAPTVTTQGAAAGAGAPALTLDKMANDGTLELVAAGDGVIVKMADATGTSDSFNIVTKVAGVGLTFGTVDVAGVETLKLNAVDTATSTIETATLTLKADKATSLTIEGSSNVTLTLDATTNKLATIDAGSLAGKLNVAASGAVAMTITGGSGADTLTASTGSSAKADVIKGGAGNDTIYAGSNGAELTGGDGNDLFILTASSAITGNKEDNTYSTITDFSAGDLLQLQYYTGAAVADATGFAKLTAVLNEDTASFSNFVDAATTQAGVGGAVWFNYKGNAYVVVDSHSNNSTTFVDGEDLIIKLTGVDGNNLSWNSDFATVALI